METAKRMKLASTKGKSISVKLKTKAKNAPEETAKFLGHGICDNISRSTILSVHTDDIESIYKAVVSLVRSMNELQASDVRGIGIQVGRLISSDASNGDDYEPTVKSKTIQELFSNPRPTNSSNNNKTPTLATYDIITWADVDLTVLKDLPDDIQQEIRQSFEQKDISAADASSTATRPCKTLQKMKGGKGLNVKGNIDVKKPGPGPLDIMFTSNQERNDQDIERHIQQIMRRQSSVCGLEDDSSICDVLREWVITEPSVEDEDVAYITRCISLSCCSNRWKRARYMLEAIHDAILERKRNLTELHSSTSSPTSSWIDVYNTLVGIVMSEVDEYIETDMNLPSTSTSTSAFEDMTQLRNDLSHFTLSLHVNP